MGLAAQDRLDAANGRGCLGKAKDDEPVFTLRAQDKLMPGALQKWISDAEPILGADHPKVLGAKQLLDMTHMWAGLNPTKYPD